jgi:hypothetical protein
MTRIDSGLSPAYVKPGVRKRSLQGDILKLKKHGFAPPKASSQGTKRVRSK